MSDIFEHNILCNKCNKKMKDLLLSRNGFNLRAKKCQKCNSIAIHSQDKAEYENYMKLKEKEYSVKMRMVGNSYAISIPKEIVNFMNEQEKMINNMVKLSFQEEGKLNLSFNTPEKNSNTRVIKSKEVRVVRNNRPILHAREFSDSANPQRNKREILTNKED